MLPTGGKGVYSLLQTFRNTDVSRKYSASTFWVYRVPTYNFDKTHPTSTQ
jgi:hypothetical protein